MFRLVATAPPPPPLLLPLFCPAQASSAPAISVVRGRLWSLRAKEEGGRGCSNYVRGRKGAGKHG